MLGRLQSFTRFILFHCFGGEMKLNLDVNQLLNDIVWSLVFSSYLLHSWSGCTCFNKSARILSSPPRMECGWYCTVLLSWLILSSQIENRSDSHAAVWQTVRPPPYTILNNNNNASVIPGYKRSNKHNKQKYKFYVLFLSYNRDHLSWLIWKQIKYK